MLDVLVQRTQTNEVTGKVKIAHTSNDKDYTLTYPFTIIALVVGLIGGVVASLSLWLATLRRVTFRAAVPWHTALCAAVATMAEP